MGKQSIKARGRLRARKYRFATFLLFFYLLLNLTVFEYYGGNPDLGIRSYTEIAAIVSHPAATQSDSVQCALPSNSDQDESQLPPDGDDCLASCTHSIPGAFAIEPLLPVIVTAIASETSRDLLPDPHPASFYRPPRAV